MTRRPLLWIVACAVALGVAAGSPVPVRAQIGPIGWTVTIDPYGGAVATRDVVVSGAARTPLGTTASSVDVELVPHLHDPGHVPSQRMQQLPLVKRRHNPGKRHYAPPGQDTQLRAAGKLPLLNEQRDPLLQVVISRRGR